jgi:hypothetical protein
MKCGLQLGLRALEGEIGSGTLDLISKIEQIEELLRQSAIKVGDWNVGQYNRLDKQQIRKEKEFVLESDNSEDEYNESVPNNSSKPDPTSNLSEFDLKGSPVNTRQTGTSSAVANELLLHSTNMSLVNEVSVTVLKQRNLLNVYNDSFNKVYSMFKVISHKVEKSSKLDPKLLFEKINI